MNRFLGILTAVVLSSCSSFLDESSQDELRPNTVQDYDKILIGEGYAYGSNSNFMPYHDFLTDDIASFPSDCPDDPGEIESIEKITPFFEWRTDMFDEASRNEVSGYNGWATLYKMIKNCNVILQSIDGAIGDDRERDFIKAQALSLRAFYYYMLVNIYCDPYNSGDPEKMAGVPWIGNFHVTSNFPERVSVAAIYGHIIQDIESALELFRKTPDMHYVVCRADQEMACGLASRVYLQMEDWEKTVEYADAVLARQDELLELRRYIKQGALNKPYTWEGSSFAGEVFESPEFIWGYCSSNSLTQFLRNTVEYSNRRVEHRAFAVSEELVNLYDCKTLNEVLHQYKGDLRLPYYYVYREYESATGKRLKKPYYATKGSISKATQFGMRTAEIYLNRAEAAIRLGRTADAVKDLDRLRLSRWSSPEDYTPIEDDPEIAPRIATPEGLLEFCREERRRELSFEHMRWFDLRRYGRPRLVHTVYNTADANGTEVVLEEGDPRYTIPLPREVTDRNPQL